MCGIAGIVSVDGFDPRRLVAMTQMIRYRGPSGYGFAYMNPGTNANPEIHHNDENLPALKPTVGLGNRRLAILDVSAAGNQPMVTEGGASCVTYNGEIYNYKELRQELEQLGHLFRTGTDTEVLLHSYQQWGEECLKRFNGMWSFALWDSAKQVLFCARDRFGVKPFYFAVTDGTFYFASEMKQILMASGMKRKANAEVVAYFLEWGLQDHLEETFFKGICQLQGGHSLTLKLATVLRPEISRYWTLETGPELEAEEASATEEFRERFLDAVKLRLRSDVPVGVCLSGGLDSSSILCQAKIVSPQTKFQTFSACFEDVAIDEREYISAAMQAAQVEGHWSFPQGIAFWKQADAIAYHQDAPIGGTSVFAQWKVMESAQQHGIPVVLGGQGGDEALCGYQKYYLFHLWHLLRHVSPLFFSESVSWARNGTNSFWTMGSVSRYFPGMLRKQYSLTERLASTRLQKTVQGVTSMMGAGVSIAERQKTDILQSSLPTLLRHEDRNSMAHSVESRLPFLDYRLVEFAVRCPSSLKLRDGWTKWILREALKDTLPEKIRLRKTKLGFNVPERNWLLLGLRNGRRHLWQTSNLRMAEFLDPRKFTDECKRYVSEAPNALAPELMFRALSLEMWARVHDVS
jgi:asparagine synthase (glutamine-hydrolysing)